MARAKSMAVDIDGSELKISVEQVTPAMAAQLLSDNLGNRNVRPSRVDQYAQDMKAGRWRFDAEPLKFTAGGRLLDGQHRLRAVIEADVPVWFVIVRGLDVGCQLTMDSGAGRSLADFLKFRGERNITHLAALASADAKWNLIGPAAAFGSGHQVVSRSQIMDWFDHHADDLREATHRGSVITVATDRIMPATMAGVLWLAFTRIDPDAADEFWTAFTSYEPLPDGHPARTLRTTLTRLRDQSNAAVGTSPRFKAAITIKSWNRFRDGQTANVLSWHPAGAKSEGFPIPR